MDSSIMAQTILNHVGGKENVIHNMICISRLRVELKDESKADLEAIKAMDGVLGIIETEVLQIVLGTTNVKRVGTEFAALTGIPLETIEIICHPGEPCPYDYGKIETTEGFIKKIASLFKKKK